MDYKIFLVIALGLLLFGCIEPVDWTTNSSVTATPAEPSVAPSVEPPATPSAEPSASPVEPSATPQPTVAPTATPAATSAPTTTPTPAAPTATPAGLKGFVFVSVDCMIRDDSAGGWCEVVGNGSFMAHKSSPVFKLKVAYYGENVSSVRPEVSCSGPKFVGTGASPTDSTTRGLVDWHFDSFKPTEPVDFTDGTERLLVMDFPLLANGTQGDCTLTLRNNPDYYLDVRRGSTTFTYAYEN